MKKIIISLIAASCSLLSIAQQQEHYSMYMQNNYLVNPAEGGTEDFIDLKMGYRTQWTNFDPRFNSTPRTLYLSGHAPIGKHDNKLDGVDQIAFHGVGGSLTNDNIGPFNVLAVKGSYAYHLPVSKSLIISLGAFAGMKQYSVSQEELLFDSQGGVDPFAASFKNTIVPDVSVGIWGYAKKYYFGISSFQLLGNKVDFYKNIEKATTNATPKGALSRHHWLTAGYKVDLTEHFFLVPSFVVKYVQNAPVTFDFNAKLRYDDKYWAGFSYRREDAIVAMAGLTLKKVLDLGYAYDITSTDIKTYSSGTHEIIVGLRIPNHQHHPPPAQFW